MKLSAKLRRRGFVGYLGAASVVASSRVSALAEPQTRRLVSVDEFGASRGGREDSTRAIQAAINAVEHAGGGTVLIPDRYRCGHIVISGHGVRLEGRGGWLVDGRLNIGTEASNIAVADLGLLDTRGDPATFLVDISGRECRFDNLRLIKDPIAGGLQMYIRHTAAGCHFAGLRLKGSNGIIIMGRDHVFEDFELESTMSQRVGGDDAFAIDGLDDSTENITIRNGIVRGYAAIVSFGSAIGTSNPGPSSGSVRNVSVENVTADRCTGIAFFKPDALDYDWRDGLVENVRLSNLKLIDRTGEYFRVGINMLAARGATIRDVTVRNVEIIARARDRRVAPTAAVAITILNKGTPATIEDVDLQVKFTDPYEGAPHRPDVPGYPIDHVVKIEKLNPRTGSMSGIVLDVEGHGAAFGGIYVGAGLDDAVRVSRALLERVATDPPTSLGGGGIWSDSRLGLGLVHVQSVRLPKFAGAAFKKGPK